MCGEQADSAKSVTELNELEREIAALYSTHARSLLRYATALIADPAGAQDALQETFMRYFVARSDGQQFADPKAWLFRVLRNYMLDAVKASSRKSEVTLKWMHTAPDDGDDPEQRYFRAEAANQLARLLAPREWECVRLRAEGLRYDEIAQVLDLREGTIGATLARAYKKLRRALRSTEDVREPVIVAPCEEDTHSSS